MTQRADVAGFLRRVAQALGVVMYNAPLENACSASKPAIAPFDSSGFWSATPCTTMTATREG
jgi:hypothetical protein